MPAITASLLRRCAGALLLFCGPAVSCTSAPQAPTKVNPIVEILGSAQPGVIAAQDLAPRSIGPTRWQRVDAQWRPTDKSPATVAATPVDGDAREWLVDGIDGTVDMIAFHSDGSLHLLRTDSLQDDARTLFDPPLLLAPSVIRGDGDINSDASMRVDSLSTQRQRDRGSAHRTMRVLRGERIRTPIGEWNATIVESVFTATLDMAVATHRTTLWIVPGIGPVMERWEASVKVLGLPVPRDRGTAVRIDPLPAPPQAQQPPAPR